MNTMLVLFCLAIGIFTGLRAFTPLAALCWAAHWSWIPVEGTPFAFLGSTAAVIVVTLIAAGELITDKLPQTGNRTAIPMLGGRILIAALCGVAISFAAQQSWIMHAVAAGVGAVAGAFGGFYLRRAIVSSRTIPAIVVALAEDVIAIGGAFFVVAHLF